MRHARLARHPIIPGIVFHCAHDFAFSPRFSKLIDNRFGSSRSWLCRLRPCAVTLEPPTIHDLARQGMTDDPFSLTRDLGEPIEIHAGFDAELLAHVDQIFGYDIACCALEAAIRAPSQAGDGGVEVVNAHLHRSQDVGKAEPTRVVQMQVDPLRRPALLHLADEIADRTRVYPSHGIRELDIFDRCAALVRHIHQPIDIEHDLVGIDGTLEVAAKRCDDIHGTQRDIVFLEHDDPPLSLYKVLLDRAVAVLLGKNLAGRSTYPTFKIEPAGGDGPRGALRVEIDAGILRAGLACEPRGNLLRIRHLRHPFRAPER